MTESICIIGANGFIGSHLVKDLLDSGRNVTAIDIEDFRLKSILGYKNLRFVKRDFRAFDTYFRSLLNESSIIIPLVAVATPKSYVTDPIGVFELDFESNLPVIRFCVDNKKRIIFPSTSEVYGFTEGEAFEESTTNLSYGPIRTERWIYASCKQLLDRIIYAYGVRHNLNYTIFRPFNWLGSGLDSISEEEGVSRLITQLLSDIKFHRKITLVDGGSQRRCFTDIHDGIAALKLIIENPTQSDKKIYNIGNPKNEFSIEQFANLLLDTIRECQPSVDISQIRVEVKTGETYYGKGYQDVTRRVPSIRAIQSDLAWEPSTSLYTTLKQIVQNFPL